VRSRKTAIAIVIADPQSRCCCAIRPKSLKLEPIGHRPHNVNRRGVYVPRRSLLRGAVWRSEIIDDQFLMRWQCFAAGGLIGPHFHHTRGLAVAIRSARGTRWRRAAQPRCDSGRASCCIAS